MSQSSKPFNSVVALLLLIYLKENLINSCFYLSHDNHMTLWSLVHHWK